MYYIQYKWECGFNDKLEIKIKKYPKKKINKKYKNKKKPVEALSDINCAHRTYEKLPTNGY